MDVGLMIELRDVTFGYEKAQCSLEVPSLAIGPGVTLVLGGNGSGKSTLLRLIAGVESPRTGIVMVGSHDLWIEEVPARRQLVYVPESPELSPYTTVLDTLELIRALRNASDESLVSALDRVGLFDFSHRTIRELSMGQRRRAMLATALIGQPQVVILDEPLETLDLEMRAFVPKWVGELRARGAAIVIATHAVASFAGITDRVLLVQSGAVTSHDVPHDVSIQERVALFERRATASPTAKVDCPRALLPFFDPCA